MKINKTNKTKKTLSKLGLPAQSNQDILDKEITDESLNCAIKAVRDHIKQYNSVGLTQITHWL